MSRHTTHTTHNNANQESLYRFATAQTRSLQKSARKLDQQKQYRLADNADTQMRRIADWMQHGLNPRQFQDAMNSYPYAKQIDTNNKTTKHTTHYWVMPDGSITEVEKGHMSSVEHVLDSLIGQDPKQTQSDTHSPGNQTAIPEHPLREISPYKAFAEGTHNNDGNGAIRVFDDFGDIVITAHHAPSPAQMNSIQKIISIQKPIGEITFEAEYENDITGQTENIQGWRNFTQFVSQERRDQTHALRIRAEFEETHGTKNNPKPPTTTQEDPFAFTPAFDTQTPQTTPTNTQPTPTNTQPAKPMATPQPTLTQKRYQSPLAPFLYDERLDKLGVQNVGTKTRYPDYTRKFDSNYASMGG